MTDDQTPSEAEFKLLLPGPQAQAALAVRAGWAGPLPEPVRQENHFFDHDGALAAAGYTLRVRDEDGRFILTAKGPPSRERGGLTVKPEEELELDGVVARAAISGESSPLEPLRETTLGRRLGTLLGDATPRHVGSFVNERRKVGPLTLRLPSGELQVTLELDRTQLPGDRVDHELEVEVPEACAEEVGTLLREWLAAEGLEWRHGTSKVKRFRAALER